MADTASQGRARAAVAPLPRVPRPLPSWQPSRRSVAVAGALLALAALAYVGARETSLFAVRAVEVRGASPSLAATVRAVLAPVVGKSLVGLSATAVAARVEQLPEVARAQVDRAFPDTLVVRITRERPLAVVRSGADAWLVSRRGRVIRGLPPRTRLQLPRVWVARAVLRPGLFVSNGNAQTALAALRPLDSTRLGSRVQTATVRDGAVVLRLRSGLELRLGKPVDVALKLAVADAIAGTLAPPRYDGPTYLDLAVPDRPVAGREDSSRR